MGLEDLSEYLGLFWRGVLDWVISYADILLLFFTW